MSIDRARQNKISSSSSKNETALGSPPRKFHIDKILINKLTQQMFRYLSGTTFTWRILPRKQIPREATCRCNVPTPYTNILSSIRSNSPLPPLETRSPNISRELEITKYWIETRVRENSSSCGAHSRIK